MSCSARVAAGCASVGFAGCESSVTCWRSSCSDPRGFVRPAAFASPTMAADRPAPNVLFGELKSLKRFRPRLLTPPLTVPAVFQVTVIPSDPEFPFDLDALELQIGVSVSYPRLPPSVRCLNAGMPADVRDQLEEAFRARAEVQKGSRMLRNLLFWMDRNLSDLLVPKCDSSAAREESAVAALDVAPVVVKDGFSFFTFSKKDESGTAASESVSQADVDADEVEGFPMGKKAVTGGMDSGPAGDEGDMPLILPSATQMGLEVLTEEQNAAVRGAQTPDLEWESAGRRDVVVAAQPNGMQRSVQKPRGQGVVATQAGSDDGTVTGAVFLLRVARLRLQNLAVLDLKSLNATLSCSRCRVTCDIALEPGVRSCDCPRCHSPFHVKLASQAVHPNNLTFARLTVAGAVLFDIRGGRWSSFCVECSAEVPLRGLPGQVAAACRSCYVRLEADVGEIQVVREVATEQFSCGAAPRRKEKGIDEGIVSGEPLPRNGACGHYKKSKRWLRFPCCRRAFPCDVCHDEKSDHPCEWAVNMICGFCAKEQKMADSCSRCGKLVTVPKVSGPLFWEGGRGCREPVMMSRKDPRKYRLLARAEQQAKQQVRDKRKS